MAAKYSSIPAVLDYLYSHVVTALTGIADTTVADGYPGTEQQSDIIAIGGTPSPVATGGQEPKTIGARSFDEDYEVEITITSYRGGSTEKVARDGAFALYDKVVAVLAADLTLGGACMWSLPAQLAVKGTDLDTAASGVTVTLAFSVRVHQRISFI